MNHTPEPAPGAVASTSTCRTCGAPVEQLMDSHRPNGDVVEALEGYGIRWWHTATLDELMAGGGQHG